MNTASCDQLIRSLADAGDTLAITLQGPQRLNVAESLMRSYEVKKILVTEFRRSKNGINWVANSNQGVDENTYSEAVNNLNQMAKEFHDLRFVNTALKMLDANCVASEQSKNQRIQSCELAERIASA